MSFFKSGVHLEPSMQRWSSGFGNLKTQKLEAFEFN